MYLLFDRKTVHYNRTLILTIFITLAFLILPALTKLPVAQAHDCGPVAVTMNVGETTTWQITADLTEDVTHYRPVYTGDTSIATLSPDTEFYSHHGVFTITATGAGQTSFAIEWYYEQTDTGGICEVVVTVKELNQRQSQRSLQNRHRQLRHQPGL